MVQPFADGIKDARWEIFENSSHVPHIEETERCLQVIGDFLAEHDKAARGRNCAQSQRNQAGRRGDANEYRHASDDWRAVAVAGALALYLRTPASAELDPAHKGGTMRLLAVGAGGTIDPHINYTLQYWQLYQSIYDGLVTFKHAAGTDGFTIVPDLAEELPPPADDGKSYTFKLRKGIKFSNGNELTVKDVVASLQRIFKVTSPTAGGFYSVIVGADKCLEDAGHLHARRRRRRRRGGRHRHHQSDAARSRDLPEAGRAPCRDPAGGFADDRCRHPAAARAPAPT